MTTEWHEEVSALDQGTLERARAIQSIVEELQAVSWYDQRIDASTDADLRAVLRHNRDEEKEHAAMLLEWLRQRDPSLDTHLRTYLFSDRSLRSWVDEEEAGGGAGSAGRSSDGRLRIGRMSG